MRKDSQDRTYHVGKCPEVEKKMRKWRRSRKRDGKKEGLRDGERNLKSWAYERQS